MAENIEIHLILLLLRNLKEKARGMIFVRYFAYQTMASMSFLSPTMISLMPGCFSLLKQKLTM